LATISYICEIGVLEPSSGQIVKTPVLIGGQRKSVVRKLVRRFGTFKATIGLTVLAILASIVITGVATTILEGGPTITGLYISIIAPAIIAPLLGSVFIRLLVQLDSAEERLYTLSIIDDLTLAYNRRHFIEAAQSELARVKRYGEVFSIAVIDVDDLKKINDTYGHLAGDQLLKTISSVSKVSIRDTDTFARYGGDEFILLLPRTDKIKAESCAERLRKLLAESPVNIGQEEIHFKVSVGIKTFEEDFSDLEGLLILADQALYAAKKEGKNRVVSI
jgi:diguanylate cyclase (GGDEF)-like protein